MYKPLRCIFAIFIAWIGFNASSARLESDCLNVDVAIVGGGTSGVAAGIEAARLGASAVIIERTSWLGGMLTSAGVSAVDGNYNLPSGLWGEFRDSLAAHYGSLEALKTGWVSNVMFEPSVGNAIFHNIVANERGLSVLHNTHVEALKRTKGRWVLDVTKTGKYKIVAKVLVDATELGDIARKCGVGYDIGMESRSDTHESIAPEKPNNIIQDLTYVAILKDYGRDVSIDKPEGYDPKVFACCCINDLCVSPKEPNRMWPKEKMVTYGKLPNNKYMVNWPIEGNDYYLNLIEMDEKQRAKELEKAKRHTMNFVYFMQHELGLKTLGLADDEFPTPDRLPFIPYHRESRRIKGAVRFTLNHIDDPFGQPQPLYRTGIAVGDYPVDHHHTRYEGTETLPDLHFHPIPSFNVPLGCLIPKSAEGLVVAEKSISVSNIVNGTTRLQPVVLQIGQAAGALSAIAAKGNCKVAEVPVRKVQKALLEHGVYLMPYADVPKDDPAFAACQRIGATGIMKGRGISVDWSNKTLFYPDSTVAMSDLKGLADIYVSARKLSFDTIPMSLADGIETIASISSKEGIAGKSSVYSASERIWHKACFGRFDLKDPLSRRQMAVLLDRILNPFERKDVTIEGKFKNE